MIWYPIEKIIKTQGLKWLSRYRKSQSSVNQKIELEEIKQILLVRQHDQFGDFLLTTPAIRALRNRFPAAHIILVVREYLYPVAYRNPDVDQVLIFHESALKWRIQDIRSFWQLIRGSTDLAVVFNTVSHSLSSDVIAWISGARLVVGPNSPTFDHIDENPFYTINVPVSHNAKHQIERNLELVRFCGAKTGDFSYSYFMSNEEKLNGYQLVTNLVGHCQGPKVAIHFGTGDVKKRYPIRQLATLCDDLSIHKSAKILIIPAPGEERQLQSLQLIASNRLYCVPPITLRQVAAVLKEVDLLVCNDTGVLHLAAAVGTPTLSFHATSDPVFWKPPNPRHRAFYAVNKKIEQIPVDLVYREITTMLNGSFGREGESIIRV
tara:strand:- start:31441 stop:32574 length:1134 start_codon:yes stop_codon:yes gene_type:complete